MVTPSAAQRGELRFFSFFSFFLFFPSIRGRRGKVKPGKKRGLAAPLFAQQRGVSAKLDGVSQPGRFHNRSAPRQLDDIAASIRSFSQLWDLPDFRTFLFTLVT